MGNKQHVRLLTFNALLIAIILVLTLVPNIGFIQIPPLSLTTIHIPVIIGAILFGNRTSIILSLAFGLSSWFVASTRGAATDLLFMNPLISVLPRLLFGLSIPLLYHMIKIKNESLRIALVALLSSIVHSFVVLVAICINLGLQGGLNVGLTVFLGAFFTLSIALEAVVAALISVPVVMGLRRVVK